MSNPDDPQVLRIGPALLTYECEKCKSKIQPKEEKLYEEDYEVSIYDPINTSSLMEKRGTIVTFFRYSFHVCPVCQEENIAKKTEIYEPKPHEPPDTNISYYYYCSLV